MRDLVVHMPVPRRKPDGPRAQGEGTLMPLGIFCRACEKCKPREVVSERASWGGEPTGECTIFCGKNCSHKRRRQRK